jgi:hypothetical protein
MASQESGSDEPEDTDVQTGSLVTQSLPHSYEQDALEFNIEEIRLDGLVLGDRGELDEESRYLSIVDEGRWSSLEIKGTVEVETETIKEVFPPDEWKETPGKLALVKTNRLAINRSRDLLDLPPLENGSQSFEIEISRDEYRGRIDLEPFLVRATTRNPGASNCASKVGARLANGEQWTIRLDDPTYGGGLLMPSIEDFSSSERYPDEQHIHYLSLDDPRNPQLYLNREHPRVVKILQNEGTRWGKARLRDLLYDYIEHSVWTQLLVQTARDTDTDTGETSYDWQEDVLEIFLEDLYPDLENEEAKLRLATDVRNVEDLPTLMERIERAVHKQYDVPLDTTKLIEEGIQYDN